MEVFGWYKVKELRVSFVCRWESFFGESSSPEIVVISQNTVDWDKAG